MPNRLIREDMLDSERVQTLPLEGRWLYVTALLSADDVGLFEVSTFKLSRKSGLDMRCIQPLITLLADADLVRCYETAGKRYGFLPRFGQRLQIKRTKHPAPPAALFADDDDASRKFKDLAQKARLANGESPRVTAAHPPEPEPEPELEAELVGTSVGARRRLAAGPRGLKKAPQDFLITSELQQWARKDCPLVDMRAETATFRDHEFATGKKDWPGTWRNWMRKEQKRLAEAAKRRVPAADGLTPFQRNKRSQIAEMTGGLIGGTTAISLEHKHGTDVIDG